jgi:hypothetical protein
MLESTNSEDFQYVVFSVPLLLSLTYVQVFLSALCSETPSILACNLKVYLE